MNPREEPVFEDYEGVPCVWIQRANGTWTLVEEQHYRLVSDRPWHTITDYSVWEGTDGTTIYMQDLICPTPEGMIADHKNRVRWDNRSTNLRPASKSQNQWNRKDPKSNTSGHPGVKSTPCGSFTASIQAYGKVIRLGTFTTFELAVEARKAGEVKYHGEFRRGQQCQSFTQTQPTLGKSASTASKPPRPNSIFAKC
jgi:hypothetical protein